METGYHWTWSSNGRMRSCTDEEVLGRWTWFNVVSCIVKADFNVASCIVKADED